MFFRIFFFGMKKTKQKTLKKQNKKKQKNTFFKMFLRFS